MRCRPGPPSPSAAAGPREVARSIRQSAHPARAGEPRLALPLRHRDRRHAERFPAWMGAAGRRHPELLDWLARGRSSAGGWKFKPLHRLIVTVADLPAILGLPRVRRGSGRRATDRYLWRFPPRRLSAEEVRDTMLARRRASSTTTMGGPGFSLYQYVEDNVATYVPLDTAGPGDLPSGGVPPLRQGLVPRRAHRLRLPRQRLRRARRRPSTTTPLQAARTLHESRVRPRHGRAFADRLCREAEAIDRGRSVGLTNWPSAARRTRRNRPGPGRSGPEASLRITGLSARAAHSNANEMIHIVSIRGDPTPDFRHAPRLPGGRVHRARRRLPRRAPRPRRPRGRLASGGGVDPLRAEGEASPPDLLPGGRLAHRPLGAQARTGKEPRQAPPRRREPRVVPGEERQPDEEPLAVRSARGSRPAKARSRRSCRTWRDISTTSPSCTG